MPDTGQHLDICWGIIDVRNSKSVHRRMWTHPAMAAMPRHRFRGVFHRSGSHFPQVQLLEEKSSDCTVNSEDFSSNLHCEVAKVSQP